MKKTNAVLAVLLLVIATMVLLVACRKADTPGVTEPTQEQLSQNTPTTEATTQPTQGAPTEESKPEHSGDNTDNNAGGNGTAEEPPVQQEPTTPFS